MAAAAVELGSKCTAPQPTRCARKAPDAESLLAHKSRRDGGRPKMCLLPGCRVTGSEETVPAICSGCGSGVLHRGCFERLEQQCLREVTKNPKFES